MKTVKEARRIMVVESESIKLPKPLGEMSTQELKAFQDTLCEGCTRRVESGEEVQFSIPSNWKELRFRVGNELLRRRRNESPEERRERNRAHRATIHYKNNRARAYERSLDVREWMRMHPEHVEAVKVKYGIGGPKNACSDN